MPDDDKPVQFSATVPRWLFGAIFAAYVPFAPTCASKLTSVAASAAGYVPVTQRQAEQGTKEALSEALNNPGSGFSERQLEPMAAVVRENCKASVDLGGSNWCERWGGVLVGDDICLTPNGAKSEPLFPRIVQNFPGPIDPEPIEPKPDDG